MLIHAHSLISLESQKKLVFQPSIFAHLINLRILKLGFGSLNLVQGPDFSTFYAEEVHLQQAVVPKLQCLALSCHTLYSAAKIIESTKGDLIEIRIDFGIDPNKMDILSF